MVLRLGRERSTEIVGATERCSQATPCRSHVEAGLQVLDRYGVEVVVVQVVFARPHHLHGRAVHLLRTTAASTQKSAFDLRPNPPPSSVTLTFTL